MEGSIIHHVCIVLALLWLLSHFDRCHPVAYFISLIYLFLVHERYVMRLKRKLRFEEKRQANQRRVLSDSETVRWLNHAVERIWPVCMEQIVSQKILLPIIPWFLQKYKPWTAKEALVQHLYLGRSPPMFTDMRVLRQSTDDDHLVLELGMNFRTADDMSAILAVKLRKRLGFGIWAKLHLMGMHVEGKVLVGVKFIRQWPFIGRLRVCFVEPPYFQMTVKPMFTHGLDVTVLPGIAGWLDKLLAVAFEQTLVEPNMLIVDVEKFASPEPEGWFSVDEKEPIAYAIVEVVEGADMKPSDMNGLADPYVKGQLGPYRFRTKTQKKTLAPKWHEEFKIPISSWESPNMLNIEVRDKDHFVDDTLGDCSVSISDLRGDGQRHDMWLCLQNIKMGRLHLAITVFEGNRKVFEGNEKAFEGSGKVVDQPRDNETLNDESKRNSVPFETAQKAPFLSESSEKSPKVADSFEPINIDGQEQTGIWVHHPGSEVSQIWEPRKGKNRVLDAKIRNDPMGSFKSSASGSCHNESSSTDESVEGNKGNSKNMVQRGLHKIGSVFRKSSREHKSSNNIDPDPSPRTNLKAINSRQIGVKLVVDDNLSTRVESPEGSEPESPSKKKVKDMAKSIYKHAERSARSVKHAFARKGSRVSRGESESTVTEKGVPVESESSDDESLPSSISTPGVEVNPDALSPMSKHGNDSFKSKENVQMTQIEPVMNMDDTLEVVNLECLDRIDGDMPNNSEGNFDVLVESSTGPELSEEKLEEERKIGLSS